MDRYSLVLAAFAPAHGAIHSPVQIQKLLFLIDRNISDLVDGPHFDFQPYNYGPFDKEVYTLLEELSDKGDVEVIEPRGYGYKSYRLTIQGQERGERILSSVDEKARQYITRLSDFVRSLSFDQLVSAIYQAYPEMKENSVFQE